MTSVPLPDLDERRARMAFARLVEPCTAAAHAEIEQHGYVGSLRRLVEGASPLSAGVAGRLVDLDLERDQRSTTLCHARIVIPGDEEWPTGLDDLDYPPHCLWVRGGGHLGGLAEVGVAVVGARGSTQYGNHVAAELGYGLTAEGHIVVSGAAYGIDAAAHRGALAADGATVAVLACGVDRAYPSAHAGLLHDIAARGVVVSEGPPGAVPLRPRFLTRNRLIAACSRGTVIVEAGLRSGSLNTAGWAVKLARPVGAIPGPVTSAASAGTNAAIREHAAELVTKTDEVLELVGQMGVDLAEVKRGPEQPQDSLAPDQRLVWEALSPTRTQSSEKVAADAGMTLSQAQIVLAGLELAGMALRDAGGWRRR